MTQTKTLPTVTTPAPGWTHTVHSTGDLTYKIVAFRGCNVIHADKLTATMVETFDANHRHTEGLAVSAKLAAIRAAR